jgi:predicted kinase
MNHNKSNGESTLVDIANLESPAAIIMIGTPGSGKSYVARELGKMLNIGILSTDDIRRELTGDEADQSHNDQVGPLLYSRAQEYFAYEQSVIIDATHFTPEQRQDAAVKCRDLGATAVAGVYVDTSLSTSLSRNRLRRRHVPEEVLQHMFTILDVTPPSLDDGFDTLVHIRNQGR